MHALLVDFIVLGRTSYLHYYATLINNFSVTCAVPLLIWRRDLSIKELLVTAAIVSSVRSIGSWLCDWLNALRGFFSLGLHYATRATERINGPIVDRSMISSGPIFMKRAHLMQTFHVAKSYRDRDGGVYGYINLR